MFFNRSDDPKPPAAPKTRPIPLLPLRDIIVFPYMVVPLFVGREKSVRALEEAMADDKEILLAAQKTAKTNDPSPEDIYTVGTVGTIVRLLRLPDGTVKVLVEGKRRARIKRFVPNDDMFLVEHETVEDAKGPGAELEAIARSVQSTFDGYAKLNKRVAPEVIVQVQGIDDPSRLADTVAVHLTAMKLQDRQEVLETVDVKKRLERLFELMNAEIEILNVEKKIRSRVKKQMEKTQKEYYLSEQMSAIQKELGERDEFKNEIQELEEKLAKKSMSVEALDKIKKELRKLKMMQPMSAEATVVRNYIDWVLALPWDDKTEENYDIEQAETILDEDHYGLKKIKERVLEYLAVQALVRKLKGPVLCLVGPPGVGKTSLARSIARSTGRKFVRLSLGGVRDEAEIRGHRRTYIGALPGRIIQSLRKAGANNPVFLLDEIDKMSSDFRGDPAAALLEVLDPEQNKSFNDHYLDLDYDLSDVMFITTANSLGGIPAPLRDRMEIIELSGYTEFEKLNIAVRYLVPRQREEAGLGKIDVDITENAIRTVIHHYTKESGVRNLERELGSICRKIARQVLVDAKDEKNKDKQYRIAAKNVPQFLGVPEVPLDQDERPRRGRPHERPRVHAVRRHDPRVRGRGGARQGQARDHRPAREGHAGVRAGGDELHPLAPGDARPRRGVPRKLDVHVHFPEFVPKDGPSAGVTMATSIASALMKIPVRRTVAMTGEITLRGRVMPIGGLKEKMLAAHRAGITTILVPKENRKDLREIPKRVLQRRASSSWSTWTRSCARRSCSPIRRACSASACLRWRS
jgi:ATP-dependent Lon protease